MRFQDAWTPGQTVRLFFKTRTTSVGPEVYARVVVTGKCGERSGAVCQQLHVDVRQTGRARVAGRVRRRTELRDLPGVHFVPES